MADPLFDLLVPYFESTSSSQSSLSSSDSSVSNYLTRLSTLSLSSLSSTEPQSLSQQSQSLLLSLQALSTRSHRPVIAAADNLSSLGSTLPLLASETSKLQDAIPGLDEEAARFSSTYGKSIESPLLDRRKKAMLLSRNVDRLSDILDLPSLLSSAISSSSGASGGGAAASSSASAASYTSALDLYAHITRLHTLYPHSALISSVAAQAEEAMRGMTTNLIGSLRAPGIKLAGGMRTIGWLRRVAPELDEPGNMQKGAIHEGGLGALFLVCRLANLVGMLDALEPLRELADAESEKRLSGRQIEEGGARLATNANTWSGGQQTERYLKRYIEIFREQSFAIVSMYKSIFPSASTGSQESQDLEARLKASKGSTNGARQTQGRQDTPDPLQPLPSALSTFPLHLVEMLSETLKAYLPNVQDKGSRESLLTQVLYCAGSLGRLGGDFGMVLALLDVGAEATPEEKEEEDAEEEWVEVMKKHRELAGRLELLASGVGTGGGTKSGPKSPESSSRKSSTIVVSP
ncbi:MAG: hypothetical protein M4579_000314 [Chaenotheca gracillima]|nr:MAG: hypothetical protein M4579_000314 [Chaenotheca gracillima]